jgi:hypothetical protein
MSSAVANVVDPASAPSKWIQVRTASRRHQILGARTRHPRALANSLSASAKRRLSSASAARSDSLQSARTRDRRRRRARVIARTVFRPSSVSCVARVRRSATTSTRRIGDSVRRQVTTFLAMALVSVRANRLRDSQAYRPLSVGRIPRSSWSRRRRFSRCFSIRRRLPACR